MVCKNNFLKDVSQGLPRGMTCTSYLSKMASQGHGLQKPLFESGFPRARLAKTTFRKWFPKGCPRAWPAKTTFRKWFPKGMACKNHFSKVVSQGFLRGMARKNHFSKVVSQGHGLQKPLFEGGSPGASHWQFWLNKLAFHWQPWPNKLVFGLSILASRPASRLVSPCLV